MKRKTYLQFLIPGFLFLLGMPVTATTAGTAPGDIRYQRDGTGETEAEANGSFPPSIFPHWVHRINYRCDACHDSLFKMEPGATPVSMDLIKQGEVCGACHNDKLAFGVSLSNCNRCHAAVEE